MTIVASPDQIFRSTATNSTCRVATTLLGIAGAGPEDAATGRAHSSGVSRAVAAPGGAAEQGQAARR